MKLMGSWEQKNENIHLTLDRICLASLCGVGGSVGAGRPFTISCAKDNVGLAGEVAAEWEVVGL